MKARMWALLGFVALCALSLAFGLGAVWCAIVGGEFDEDDGRWWWTS